MNLDNKKRILIVDDEPMNIKIIASLLHDDYILKIANSGVKAIHIAQTDDIDLILLDILMPEKSGFEVAKDLKDNPKTRKIDIMFITSKHDKESVVEGFRLGAVDFITKPFSKEELSIRINIHMENISLRQKLKESLTYTERQLKTINTYVNYSKTDLNGTITAVSEAFCNFVGYSQEYLIGKNHRILKSGLTNNEIYISLWKTVEKNNETWYGEVINEKRNGTIYYINARISPEFNDIGDKIGYIGFYEDITDKKTIEKLAQIDHLTQLYNRQKIDEVLQREFLLAEKLGTSLSILMLDIDRFKLVNDQYGHQVGDTVLIEFSKILLDETRRSDFAGRFGGEEFLIIIPNTSLSNAILLAEKLRKKVSEFTFSTIGHKTVSIGVSSYRNGDYLPSLIKRADDGLYLAKNSGRNLVKAIEE